MADTRPSLMLLASACGLLIANTESPGAGSTSARGKGLVRISASTANTARSLNSSILSTWAGTLAGPNSTTISPAFATCAFVMIFLLATRKPDPWAMNSPELDLT